MSGSPADTTTGSRRWISLSAACLAAGIVWLAFADHGVAIPTIADEFRSDLSTLQWANNAFSLVTGALVIAAGKFGDVFGRRKMQRAGAEGDQRRHRRLLVGCRQDHGRHGDRRTAGHRDRRAALAAAISRRRFGRPNH